MVPGLLWPRGRESRLARENWLQFPRKVASPPLPESLLGAGVATSEWVSRIWAACSQPRHAARPAPDTEVRNPMTGTRTLFIECGTEAALAPGPRARPVPDTEVLNPSFGLL